MQRLQLAPAEVVRRAGLPPVDIEQRIEISTEHAFALWRAIEQMSGDPLIGFKLMKAASKVGTDSTFLAATRAATFHDALESYIQTRRLHSPARIVITTSGETVRYTRQIPDATGPEPAVGVDFTLGTLLALGRVGTGRPIAAARVELARSAPRLAFHETFYGCKVRYGAPRNMVAFHQADLRLPFVSRDAETKAALMTSINQLIAQRMSGETIERTVKAAIKQVMADRRPTLENVAGMLGLSERSLQRRVTERDKTFRQLLIEARQEIAETLLSDTTLKMDAIAYRLRYADTASFLRAFRTWQGMSPTQWKSADR